MKMNLAFQIEAQQATARLSWFAKFRVCQLGKKLYLGHEKRDGWLGPLPFYLFWCGECEHYAKDYPHGHIEKRYLICSYCGIQHDFVPWWISFVEFWQLLKFIFRLKTNKLKFPPA